MTSWRSVVRNHHRPPTLTGLPRSAVGGSTNCASSLDARRAPRRGENRPKAIRIKPPSPTNTYRLAQAGRRWFDKLRQQFGRPEGAPERRAKCRRAMLIKPVFLPGPESHLRPDSRIPVFAAPARHARMPGMPKFSVIPGFYRLFCQLSVYRIAFPCRYMAMSLCAGLFLLPGGSGDRSQQARPAQ